MRVVIGLCMTGLSVILLVFPGDLVMPMTVSAPLFRVLPSPCFNFLALPFVIALFGVGILLSIGLIVVGLTAIVLTAVQVPGGLITAVLFNVTVATLFLLVPATFSANEFSSRGELATNGAFYAAAALVPLAAAALMLARSFYRSSSSFLATVVVVSVLLLPGALSVTAFGLTLAGVPVMTVQPASRAAHC